MSITGILPPLLIGIVAGVAAFWLWQRPQKTAAIATALLSAIIIIVTFSIFAQDRNRTQAIFEVELLLKELHRSDLLTSVSPNNQDKLLYLAGASSQALFRARSYATEHVNTIDSTLFLLAKWSEDHHNLPQWKKGADWDREVFFLAYAGMSIAHYRIATGDDRFDKSLKAMGTHLGQRIKRSHYKHLISHSNESFFRPADNAAAMYTLRLYDHIFDTNYAASNLKDWSKYVSDELYYAESRLPCSAFSETNRCRLDATAVSLGLYISYQAAAVAGTPENTPWREWQHYFSRTSLNPWSISIRPNMRNGESARFCNQGALPLPCGYHESAVGMRAASEYEGWYTYFRLFCGPVLRRWFNSDQPAYSHLSPVERIIPLTNTAIRAIAMGHI